MAEDKPGAPSEGTPPEETTPTAPATPSPPGVVHEIKPGEITFTAETSMNSPHAAQLMLGAAVLAAGAAGGYAPQEHRGGRKSSGDRAWDEAMRRLYIGRDIPKTLGEFGEKISKWLETQVDQEMKPVPLLSGKRVSRRISKLWNAWHRCRGCERLIGKLPFQK
jgi:hypothetical protein